MAQFCSVSSVHFLRSVRAKDAGLAIKRSWVQASIEWLPLRQMTVCEQLNHPVRYLFNSLHFVNFDCTSSSRIQLCLIKFAKYSNNQWLSFAVFVVYLVCQNKLKLNGFFDQLLKSKWLKESVETLRKKASCR